MLTQELCMGQMAFTIIKLQFSENIDDAVVFFNCYQLQGVEQIHNFRGSFTSDQKFFRLFVKKESSSKH